MDDRFYKQRALRKALAALRKEHPELTSDQAAAVSEAIENITESDVVDVTHAWKSAMYALGFEATADHLNRVDVILIPPVVMIGMAVDSVNDFGPDDASEEEHEAMTRSIMAVLRSAGWPILMDEDGDLTIDMTEMNRLRNEATDPWEPTISQFRQELDTLYPDKPSTPDPLSKWLNPEETDESQTTARRERARADAQPMCARVRAITTSIRQLVRQLGPRGVVRVRRQLALPAGRRWTGPHLLGWSHDLAEGMGVLRRTTVRLMGLPGDQVCPDRGCRAHPR
jgi:hypothetical protein